MDSNSSGPSPELVQEAIAEVGDPPPLPDTYRGETLEETIENMRSADLSPSELEKFAEFIQYILELEAEVEEVRDKR